MKPHAFIAIVCLSFCVAPAIAQSPPDWKLFGFSDVEGKDSELFFLRSGIRRTPEGHLLVWTKGLEVEAVENSKHDEVFIEEGARLVLAGYTPPYSQVQKITDDQKLTLIIAELTANRGEIVPQARILYEIDCQKRVTRELSIEFVLSGKRSSSDKPKEWRHAPPETNAAALVALTCPKTVG